MRRFALVAALSVFSSGAVAGFDSWTSEIEKDPFSGGEKITVTYSSSIRSGVYMFCDTAESGVEIRAVPGYIYEAGMTEYKPAMEFAIDGTRLEFTPGPASVVSVGDNLAAVNLTLSKEQAVTLVKAFASAKRQIAIKDGMSDRPHLLRATGSTRSGQAIVRCVEKQQ